MNFTSVVFMFFFFPAFIMFAWLLREKSVKTQNVFLWLASVVFYGWCGLEYLVLLFAEIVCNWLIGNRMSYHQDSEHIKKRYLAFGIVLDLGILGVCKYFHFMVGIIQGAVRIFAPEFTVYQPNIPLPLGVSFIIFQMIAYLMDVYRGKIRQEESFMDFSLYLLFFPKIVMGPITRYEDMSAALKSRSFSDDAWSRGLSRFCWGFAKKMLLANQVAVLADAVFAIQGGQNFIIAWVGAIAYTVQIYIDFSSYSDMAIGISLMAGFRIPENFDYPYISTSIQEFWRRWHITLNTWFRDYLYIPLGGNRVGKVKLYRNLGIVFLLTGLWHGADWSFIVWGLFHGLFSILERTGWGKRLEKLPRVVRHMYTLLVVTVGWVFFRADSLAQGLTYIKAMFTLRLDNLWQIAFWEKFTPELLVFFAAALIACVPKRRVWLKQEWLRQGTLAVMMLFSLYVLLASDFSPFIYLKF